MWFVVPAAGIGSRFNSTTPKQYTKLTKDKTILEYTIEALRATQPLTGIVVVIKKNDPYWNQLSISRVPEVYTCFGGEQRQDSVYSGLSYIAEHESNEQSWVMVHDAARPAISQDLISKLYQAVTEGHHPGGILATRLSDTIKYSNNNIVDKTVDRKHLWAAQTPQLFRLKDLIQSYHYANSHHLNITDESSAIEQFGLKPVIVESSPTNFKITSQDDLTLMQQLINFD